MIDDEQTVRALRAAMTTAVQGHHLGPDAATAALDRLDPGPPEPRRRAREYLAVAAACVVVAGAATGIYAATSSSSRSGHPAARAGGSACDGNVTTGPLPVWARAGFRPPDQNISYVTGSRGDIVAVGASGLHFPPLPKGPNNKIIWITRDNTGGGSLIIDAQLEGSNQTATRSVPGGPGPSIIDLPAAGCWRLTLTWGTHRETLAVRYLPSRPTSR